jgi:hypothetical protein
MTGTVVAMLDSLPDNSLGTHDTAHPLGNYVIVGEGDRFIYIAHLSSGVSQQLSFVAASREDILCQRSHANAARGRERHRRKGPPQSRTAAVTARPASRFP